VIPTIITQALTSNTIKLGSLTPVRDLTYVGDTVQGFLNLAESKKAIGKTINIGTGRGVTMGELANQIVSLVNPKAKIVCEEKRIRPEKSEVMKLVCDNTLIREVTGWEPQYTLEEGLVPTIEWMKQNISDYKSGIYTV
jgi:dTDP-glucose 4,6-dehydratase